MLTSSLATGYVTIVTQVTRERHAFHSHRIPFSLSKVQKIKCRPDAKFTVSHAPDMQQIPTPWDSGKDPLFPGYYHRKPWLTATGFAFVPDKLQEMLSMCADARTHCRYDT
jgi:hypothetical protein